MLFKPDLIKKIVTGEKTVTRRIWNDGDVLICWTDGKDEIQSISQNSAKSRYRLKYKVGRDYAVVPKMNHHACWLNKNTGKLFGHGLDRQLSEFRQETYEFQPLRIKVLSLDKQRLQNITEQDAKDEGLAGLGSAILGFTRLWDTLAPKGKQWHDNPYVAVIEFEVMR